PHLACVGLQVGVLLHVRGGLQTPFAILILARVPVAATALGRRSVIVLSVFAILVFSGLTLWHLPLPWRGEPPVFPAEMAVGIWIALVLATMFFAAFTWSVAPDVGLLRDAVAVARPAV